MGRNVCERPSGRATVTSSDHLVDAFGIGLAGVMIAALVGRAACT